MDDKLSSNGKKRNPTNIYILNFCLSFISIYTGSYMLAWKRGIAILTVGQVKVSPDPRVRLVNGNTLQIRDAVPSDAGDYICQIASFEPQEITHHVEILSKNKIHVALLPLDSTMN